MAMTIIGVVAISTGPLAYADNEPGLRDPGVNARQERQKNRIKQGIRSGELTKREAKRLRDEHSEIKQLEAAYKSDGKLTQDERKDLHHELNENSKKIRKQKHDGQTR